MNSSSVVSVEKLTKSFGQNIAVNGISFEVFRGECLGILGPNGAGKTTTMKMLLGTVVPNQGNISILGFDALSQSKQMREQVGVVPQHDNLDIDFSVSENLYTYASYFGIKRSDIRTRTQELLEYAALAERANASVEALSGGMRRRLMLARALINDPEIIFLDEPTTGLDPQARQLIWQRLRTLLKVGRTLIMTTHYLEEAERLCDRILLVDKGMIIEEGTPKGLISKHIEPHVFELYDIPQSQAETIAFKLGCERYEMSGATLFCYSHSEEQPIQALTEMDTVKYLHRRGNLEDVFVKLTGRELRDG